MDSARNFYSEYNLGPKVGKGAFAQVHAATAKQTHEELAVKIVDIRHCGQSPSPTHVCYSVDKEVNVWQAVGKHANCVHLHASFHDESLCYMVMEKCTSLLPHLRSMEKINERTIGHVFSQMLLGVSHLHSVNVVHRDIKPDNFLVGSDGVTIKLADFGLSALLPRGGKLLHTAGTPWFTGPEMLSNRGYNEKVDIWSLGVVTYLLLFGSFPYMPKEHTAADMHKAIAEGSPPVFEAADKSFRSDVAVDFVKALLTRNPKQRPSASDALAMPYIGAVVSSRHEPDVELPSLRPMLRLAGRLGAFDVTSNAPWLTSIDAELTRLQKKQMQGNFSVHRSRDSQRRPSLALLKKWAGLEVFVLNLNFVTEGLTAGKEKIACSPNTFAPF